MDIKKILDKIDENDDEIIKLEKENDKLLEKAENKTYKTKKGNVIFDTVEIGRDTTIKVLRIYHDRLVLYCWAENHKHYKNVTYDELEVLFEEIE